MASDPSAKAVQIDPVAHPGAMVALMLSPEQQQALRDAAGVIDAEADHITLCYLGDDAQAIQDRKNEILSALTALACATPPVQGTIGGVARFNASPGSGGQDVCVALYDCACLPDLRQAVMACCGQPASEHGFMPHITLGYLAPDAPMPVAQLERTPLEFDCIALVWAGERIDLPLQGGVMSESITPMVEEKALGTEGMAQGGALVPEEEEEAEEPAGTAKTALALGGAVKALPGDPYQVRTRGIVWGGHDLGGDTFVKGETDLGRSRSFVGMPVYYDHAQRGIKSQIGTVVGAEEDDEGIVFAIELDRSKAYVKDVQKLEREGALGSSTGAVGHLVRRKKGVLKRWIVGEISVTPTPMEPRTHPAFAGKSLSEEDITMGDTQPTQETQPGADVAQLAGEIKGLKDKLVQVETAVGTKADTAVVQAVRSDLDEIRSMPAVKSAKSRDPMAAAEELGGSIGGGLNRYADSYHPFSYHNMKALSSVSHPGSPTRQTEYPEGVFGGFVKAVFMSNKADPRIQRDALKALDEMYGASSESDAAKALGTSAGVSGAWLIPEQFIPQLMAIAGQNDVLYGSTMVIPVDGGEVVIPALDPSTAYSEGQSAYYGGVTVTWGSDDDAAISTEPKFKQVRLKTNALKAFTRVKNALMMRSAISIDAVVGNLLGGAIGRARDYAILRGTGQGQPLGTLNSPATIDQGGSAIDFATLTAMEDNVIPERDANYIWVVHTKKRSAIWTLQQTNNTLVTYLPDLRGKPQQVLLGRNVKYTDKTPFASGDVSNTVNLIDPSMIVCAEFQGIALAVSDQARFEQDETVIRAIMSMDAQPWLTNKVAVTSTPDYVSGFITI
jgi:HK97 family phage major capsid protein